MAGQALGWSESHEVDPLPGSQAHPPPMLPHCAPEDRGSSLSARPSVHLLPGPLQPSRGGGEAVSLKLFVGQHPGGSQCPREQPTGSGVRGQRGRVLSVAAPLGSLFSEGIGAPGLSTYVWPSASVDRGLCGPQPPWAMASVDHVLSGLSPPWAVASVVCGPCLLWTTPCVSVHSVDCGSVVCGQWPL